jgi:hypothetical protein
LFVAVRDGIFNPGVATEMMFFVRHPALAVAIPLAAGFVAANLGKSGIRTAAAWTVLVVLAVAAYRSADADPDRPLAAF